MQKAQLTMVANLKFLFEKKEKEYSKRSVSIFYSNLCVFHTLCRHVQTSSPSRFQFNSRKTFSNVSTFKKIFFSTGNSNTDSNSVIA